MVLVPRTAPGTGLQPDQDVGGTAAGDRPGTRQPTVWLEPLFQPAPLGFRFPQPRLQRPDLLLVVAPGGAVPQIPDHDGQLVGARGALAQMELGLGAAGIREVPRRSRRSSVLRRHGERPSQDRCRRRRGREVRGTPEFDPRRPDRPRGPAGPWRRSRPGCRSWPRVNVRPGRCPRSGRGCTCRRPAACTVRVDEGKPAIGGQPFFQPYAAAVLFLNHVHGEVLA